MTGTLRKHCWRQSRADWRADKPALKLYKSKRPHKSHHDWHLKSKTKASYVRIKPWFHLFIHKMFCIKVSSIVQYLFFDPPSVRPKTHQEATLGWGGGGWVGPQTLINDVRNLGYVWINWKMVLNIKQKWQAWPLASQKGFSTRMSHRTLSQKKSTLPPPAVHADKLHALGKSTETKSSKMPDPNANLNNSTNSQNQKRLHFSSVTYWDFFLSFFFLNN